MIMIIIMEVMVIMIIVIIKYGTEYHGYQEAFRLAEKLGVELNLEHTAVQSRRNCERSK